MDILVGGNVFQPPVICWWGLQESCHPSGVLRPEDWKTDSPSFLTLLTKNKSKRVEVPRALTLDNFLSISYFRSTQCSLGMGAHGHLTGNAWVCGLSLAQRCGVDAVFSLHWLLHGMAFRGGTCELHLNWLLPGRTDGRVRKGVPEIQIGGAVVKLSLGMLFLGIERHLRGFLMPQQPTISSFFLPKWTLHLLLP